MRDRETELGSFQGSVLVISNSESRLSLDKGVVRLSALASFVNRDISDHPQSNREPFDHEGLGRMVTGSLSAKRSDDRSVDKFL